MVQNEGNDAKIKEILLQLSSIWGENVGKIYSTWNPSYNNKKPGSAQMQTRKS